MAASVAAAITALQVIKFGKHKIAVFKVIMESFHQQLFLFWEGMLPGIFNECIYFRKTGAA